MHCKDSNIIFSLNIQICSHWYHEDILLSLLCEIAWSKTAWKKYNAFKYLLLMDKNYISELKFLPITYFPSKVNDLFLIWIQTIWLSCYIFSFIVHEWQHIFRNYSQLTYNISFANISEKSAENALHTWVTLF